MTTLPTPFHQAQIVRGLPSWATTMHPEHTHRIVQSVRKDYLDESGSPYSWYAAASHDEQTLLRQHMGYRDARFKALQAALKDFKQIHEFCKPLLKTQLGLDVEVDQAQYLHQPFKVFATPIGLPGFEISLGNPQTFENRPDGPAEKRSLLEAALHNFEGPEEAGPFDDLTISPTNDASLARLDPEAFINHCRTLDLGQRYQDHLQSIYEGPQRREIERLWIDVTQKALSVEARIAHLKNLLTRNGRDGLIALCNNDSGPRYGKEALHCWRFSLFGIPIHDVLLIGPDAADQANPCILYIPQDTEHPVREYASQQQLGAHLRQRLLQITFRRHLVRFADQDRQVELAHRLETALFEQIDDTSAIRKNPLIHITTTPLPLPFWPALYRDHARRLKANARAIAVPTADADAKARKAQLQHWLDAGMNVLNVAAFFVPGLDVAMLGVFAYDIMDSVFTGFEAWEAGDTHEALQQLESLAINAATIAGFAVGARVLKASGFVDALKSVSHGNRERLWQPDMGPYASEASLPVDAQPNAKGLYAVDGKDHVLLEGQLYEVFESADGQWRVRHPENTDAYNPALRYLGDHRWQLDHDDPLIWNDTQLLQGLGQFTQGLDASEQLSALRITATDADILRHGQVNGSRPPAMLADTLLRLRLDNDVQSTITRVRHGLPLAAYIDVALPELVTMPGWPPNYRLKVFTGPEKWGDAVYYGAEDTANPLLIEIARSELDEGQLSKVVLDQMDGTAINDLLKDIAPSHREQVLNEQLANRLTARRQEVFASRLNSHQPSSSAEGQAIGRQFPSVPAGVLEELVKHADSSERQRMASGRVPLRIAEEARHLQARVRLDHALLGLYRPTLANTDSARLREALLASHPKASDADLLALAVADRPYCAKLLGQQPIKPRWHSPLRLAHGRIGYPLSGRGNSSAAARRLQSLFPSLSASQRSALQAELSATGDLGAAVKQLQAEWHALRRGLDNWVLSATDVFESQDRQICAELLEDAWHQEGEVNRETLVLEGLRIPRLPEVNPRLRHIRQLRLTGLQLQQLDAQFLSCFPNLQVLEVTDNPHIDAQGLFKALLAVPRLRRLDLTGNALATLSPAAQEALAAMPDLRELDLRRNQLTLEESTLAFLARRQLDVLRLSNNRITLDEKLAKGFQDLIHPQRLELAFNPLQRAPDVSYMARLQHLDLQECSLPAWPPGLTTLMSQPQYQLRYVNLSSNRIHHVDGLSNILRTPYARDVNARLPERRWLFNYNDMETETRRRLRNSGVNVFEHAPERPEWQAFWRTYTSADQDQLWADLFEHSDDNGDLQAVVERLTYSKEAQDAPLGLRQRVWSLLSDARDDTALRKRLNEVAQLHPPTCGDAGADAFSALEVELLAYRAVGEANDSVKPLFDLYRQLYRREKVNELADRISFNRGERKKALLEDVMDEDLPAYDELDVPAAYPDEDLITGLVDDIEIRLALRQSLASRLDFPEPSSEMLYREIARINPQIIDNVEAAVRVLDADTAARQQWMAEQPVWRKYLQDRNASQFKAIVDFWRPGTDYLFYCLDAENDPVEHLDNSITRALTQAMPASPLDENGVLRRVPLEEVAFDFAMRALDRERQEVEAGLLLSLTRQSEIASS